MSILWNLVPVLLMIPLWWYLYKFIIKGLLLFLKNIRAARGISFVVSGAVMIPAMALWSSRAIWTIVALHLCAFLALVDFFSFLMRKLCKGEPKAWLIVHRTAVIPVLCTSLLIGLGSANIRDVVRTEYTVATEKDIREEGYRIALIADTHYGLLDNREDIVALANTLSGDGLDLVVLCGDIVDENSSREEVEEIFEILGGIESTFGTYFVYGNHDKARYTSTPAFTEAELADVIQQGGVTVLEDAAVALTEDFTLIGRKDKSLSPAEVATVTANADQTDFLLLVDHQPYEYAEKAAAGIDLTLSGHTHAGQIFPFGLLSEIIGTNDMQYGLEMIDGMNAVVTSGVTGWGFPVRTEGRSEYVVVSVQKV